MFLPFSLSPPSRKHARGVLISFSVYCAGNDEQLGKLVYNALETATGSFVLLYEWILQWQKKMGPFLTTQEREKIDNCKKQVGI